MTASTPSIWERLCRALGREDLIDDPRFEDNAARVEHSDEINGIVREWVGERTRDEVQAAFNEHEVAYGFAYDMEDVFNDPHYRERGSIVRVTDEDLGEAAVQDVVPRFSESPGSVDHLGARIGEHNEEVYREKLGYPSERLEELREKGII